MQANRNGRRKEEAARDNKNNEPKWEKNAEAMKRTKRKQLAGQQLLDLIDRPISGRLSKQWPCQGRQPSLADARHLNTQLLTGRVPDSMISKDARDAADARHLQTSRSGPDHLILIRLSTRPDGFQGDEQTTTGCQRCH